MTTEKQTTPWKLWNGYGPLPDGMMRVVRIGPENGGGYHRLRGLRPCRV